MRGSAKLCGENARPAGRIALRHLEDARAGHGGEDVVVEHLHDGTHDEQVYQDGRRRRDGQRAG